ncbi:hypothetical protein KR093_007650 [Drosophila rubida]|uniref:RING-type domain-containing protein n=1 Tax=Drosophila rubida TaxID=30044 RepID=A0AAD4KAH7_9MUSC|nr:hypothetical protein KR093_007650 [Drosophila rubida]
MSSNAASVNPHTKMLNDINITSDAATHKINNQNTHHQMIQAQQQQKIHQIPLSEDPRTLQLALELSLVGLNEHSPNPNSFGQSVAAQGDYELASINLVSAGYAAKTEMPIPNGPGSSLLMSSAGLDDRSKKSQNMTECVPVPSSEHVAEIVGRQGCKIKALRAKTNTYIKTPVRGEEPVFVVTGRKEDVNKAKREILSAADHFSLIRASRKPSMEGSNNSGGGLISNSTTCSSLNTCIGIVTRNTQSGPPCLPGQITIQVRVPYRVVGLVVGPKGATIKHIQQETQTYIVTPSREKEPIFEVTGLPENVETARKQIEAHIALRTGNNSTHGSENGTESIDSATDFATTLNTINTLTQILNDDINSDILSSIYAIDTDTTSCNYTSAENTQNISNPVTASTVSNLSNCFEGPEVVNMAKVANATLLQPSSTSVSKLNDSSNKFIENSNASKNITNSINCVKTSSSYRNTTQGTTSHKSLSFCAPASISISTVSNASTNVVAHCHLSSANILTRSCSSASSTTSTKSTNNSANSSHSINNTPPELLNIWKNLSDSIDVDEGIGDSPSIWNQPTTAVNVNVATTTVTHSHCSPTASISPTDSLLAEQNILKTTTRSRVQDIPSCHNLVLRPTGSPIKIHNMHRECFVCNKREVTTALVPCGHNMFCMDCANQICVSMESICPICHSIVYHAMRILA